MSGWQTLINGVSNRDIRNVLVLSTISGAQKFEIELRDVKNMNDIKHFDDVEIWAPVKDSVGGLRFDGTDDYIALANTLEMDSDDWAISWWMKYNTFWLNGWNRRKTLTLTGGSSGAQIDYVRYMSAFYASNMQNDFDDLRFTDVDGNPLDAWLESKVNGGSAKLWVKFPETPANGETIDYYMYYGNMLASNNWSAENTFPVSENFENGDTTDPDGFFVTSTNLASTDHPYNGTYGIKFPSGGTYQKSESLGSLSLDTTRIMFWVYCQDATSVLNDIVIADFGNGNTDKGARIQFNNGQINAFNWGVFAGISESYFVGDWKKVEIIQSATTYKVRISDGVWHGPYNNYGGQTLTSVDRVWIAGEDVSGYFDVFAVTPYVDNPPTTSFGSETYIHECIFSEFKLGNRGMISAAWSENRIQVISSTFGQYSKVFNIDDSITDNEWHHFVLDFSSTATKLYVDNILSDTDIANPDSAAFDINYIGYSQCSTAYGDALSASLADIRVFDNSVDVDEVERLYLGKYNNVPKAFYTLHQSSAEDDAIYDRFEFSHGTSYTGLSTKGALTLDTSPLNQFIAFKGRIDKIIPDYDTNTVVIAGRDYVGGLLKRACVESYTTQLRSYIVDDIVLKYGTDMTRREIDASPAGTTMSYLFKTSAWDAVVKCAKEDGYRFWCDVDKDFHYHVKGYLDSGITIEVGVSDILEYNVEESGSEVMNRVTIYGEETGGTQIIAMVEDLDSQEQYGGIFEKRLVDLSIETTDDAIQAGEKYLEEHAYVPEIVEMKLLGHENLVVGDLITLKIPDINIDGSYLIIEKQLAYPRGITTIKVAKYAKNLEGLIADMVDKILMIEKFFMEEGSAVTKIFRINESVDYTDRILIEKQATNDSFKIGIENWCVIGETKIGGRGGEWTTVYDSG